MPIGPPQKAIVGVTRFCHVESMPISAQSLPMPASPVLEVNRPKSISTGTGAPLSVWFPTAPITVATSPFLPQWPAVLIEYAPGEPYTCAALHQPTLSGVMNSSHAPGRMPKKPVPAKLATLGPAAVDEPPPGGGFFLPPLALVRRRSMRPLG